MPITVLGGTKLADTGFDVANSCRFNAADSSYVHKTQGTSTNTDKYTLSVWLKRGANFGAVNTWFSEGVGLTAQADYNFKADGTMMLYNRDASSNIFQLVTTRVFRDPGAWYHVVLLFDSSQGTAANRMKLYINGVQESSFSTATYPAQDLNSEVNKGGTKHTWAAFDSNGSIVNEFDGYIAEALFLDGTVAAIGDLGEFDSDSPSIWKPKDVSGLTFGTNGYYLDWEASDNLGNDANGGTDFTEVNLAAADQAVDTPTNSFCTMNPLDNYRFAGTFSEGNCHIVSSSSNYAYTTGTMGMTAGKWYYEVEFDAQSSAGDYSRIGFAGIMSTGNAEMGSQAHNYAYYGVNGYGYYSGSSAALGTTYTTGDIVSVALDLDNLKVYYAKNGTWVNSGDPESGATGTGAQTVLAASTTPIGAYLPALNYVDSSITGTFKCNFGGCSAFTVSSANQDGNGYGNFEYAVPSGYLALCTKNLGSDGG